MYRTGGGGDARLRVIGILCDPASQQGIRVLGLAQLASEEIFSTEARLAVAAAALERLRTDLLEFHCSPDQVLIRAVRFPEGYEAKLQEHHRHITPYG